MLEQNLNSLYKNQSIFSEHPKKYKLHQVKTVELSHLHDVHKHFFLLNIN